MIEGMFRSLTAEEIARETSLSVQAVNRNLKAIRQTLYRHEPFFINDIGTYLFELRPPPSPMHARLFGFVIADLIHSENGIIEAMMRCVLECPLFGSPREVVGKHFDPLESVGVLGPFHVNERGDGLQFIDRVIRKKKCSYCRPRSGFDFVNFFCEHPASYADLIYFFSSKRLKDKSLVGELLFEALIFSFWNERIRGLGEHSASYEAMVASSQEINAQFNEFTEAAMMRLYLAIHDPGYVDRLGVEGD